ncbi:MAG: outer membrane beta-barrel protein [Sphingobacteriales bacterium]|nr:outer membrane beta-barrel protein [Sphingobacteriales bacterium]
MQKAEFRNMFNLLCKQAIAIGILFITGIDVMAQREINLPDHDSKPYYFGITLSYNSSYLHASHNPKFLQSDTIMVAEPYNAGGFGLGLLATGHLSDRFEIRVNPQLVFASKTLRYITKYDKPGEYPNPKKNIESILMSLPLQIKFKSDRIDNFRVYMLAGLKFDYDMASNSTARRAEDLVKLKPGDYGFEGGIGFNFYFKSFIFSPEIKISNGFNNIHSRDANLKFSNVLDRLQSRMIMFSIHLEG